MPAESRLRARLPTPQLRCNLIKNYLVDVLEGRFDIWTIFVRAVAAGGTRGSDVMGNIGEIPRLRDVTATLEIVRMLTTVRKSTAKTAPEGRGSVSNSHSFCPHAHAWRFRDCISTRPRK